MPLPIIIFLERHWDVAPKRALINELSFLKESGYDTLCFESPGELNEQETILNIESTIQFIEKRLSEVNQYLSGCGIAADLLAMNYIKLQQLLLNVSSRYYREMALWFKELPAHKEKLNLVRMANERNIKICGIDLPSSQLEQINSFESQTNLTKRVSGINELDTKRTLAFKKNLLELQQQGKGVVFVVGQDHYKLLAEEFAKEYLLDEIIFLHPYAFKCLVNLHNDYNLPSLSHLQGLTLLEEAISNHDDLEFFSKNFQTTVQPMLDNSTSIAPTSTCKLLSEKTKLHFEAFVRPSCLVDCYHFFNNRQTVTSTVKQLNEKGAHGFFTLFKNKESYCVPSVNTQEVASQVQKMDL